MSEDYFDKAHQLFSTLSDTRLGAGKSFRTELRLGQDISLWDVLATYILLYRFPVLFANEADSSWRSRLKSYLKPYRGMLGQLKNSVLLRARLSNKTEVKWDKRRETILFLGFMPTFYRDVLHPIAELLSKKNDIQVIVLGDTPNNSEDIIANENIKHQTIWDYWNHDLERSSRLMLSQLTTLQKEFVNSKSVESLTQCMSLNFRTNDLLCELKWLFHTELTKLIPQVIIAKKILEEYEPSLVVSADDADQRCRVYSLFARTKGISSLLVQQGHTDRNYPEWRFLSHDIIAAMGSKYRDDMISQGVNPDQIEVTGHPGFDHLAKQEPDLKHQIQERFGLSPNQKIILFASQPYYIGVFNNPAIRIKMIKEIVQVSLSIKEISLLVKPHPGDDVQELEQLIGNAPNVIILDRKEDITPLIKACDILVTFFSTVGLQALYNGKPVINLDFPDSGITTSIYSDSGATWIARSSNEIKKSIQQLIGDNRDEEIKMRKSNSQRFIKEMAYLPDGCAKQRIVRIISKIIKKKGIRGF